MKTSRTTWIAACYCLMLAVHGAVAAAVDIVVDDFDSYVDSADFQAAWGETTGLGTATALPADHNSGILTDNAAILPGIQGKAVDHIGAVASVPGMVNQWGGPIDQTSGADPAFSISPSSSQNIILSFDLFTAGANERMTVGLRSITALPDGLDADTFADANTANILELGQFNQNPTLSVPGAPTVSTQFAYRLINFGAVTSPVTAQPNWQFFTLAPELDRASDGDSLTNLADIGAGWHTYSATITTTSITLELDLFRDGKTNLTREGGTGAIEVGVGADGVDASITYQILTLPQGFNALRFGGPSGLTSPGPGTTAFDNISLRLVDIVPEPTSLVLAGIILLTAGCRLRL